MEFPNCRICNCALKLSKTVNVGPKGLQKLISVSEQREDRFFYPIDVNDDNVIVHVKCRAIYINDSSVAAAVKRKNIQKYSVIQNTTPTSTTQQQHIQQSGPNNQAGQDHQDEKYSVIKDTTPMSTTQQQPGPNNQPGQPGQDHQDQKYSVIKDTIDTSPSFQKQCFICNKDASDRFLSNEKKKPVNRRITVSKVMKKKTRETIINSSYKHDDHWSKEVRERINDIDLVDVKARYHNACFITFTNHTRPSGRGKGRPECPQILEQMEHIYQFIESELDDSPFSITDIRDSMTIELPSAKTIKRKLIDHYGDKLIITEYDGRPTIFCLDTTPQTKCCNWKNNSTQKDRLTQKVKSPGFMPFFC